MSDAPTRPTVSVCSPTYQGGERLRRTAPGILAALGPDDEWIVAVDGSTDDSAAFLEQLAREDARVKPLVLPTNQGRTEALNAACRAARRDIVLRVDDDILVQPDFVDLHAQTHAAHDAHVGVVQPIVDLIEGAEAPSMWRDFVTRNAAMDAERFAAGADGLPAAVWGAACSVERTVGDALEWYDSRFQAYGWEDVEFGYRLTLAGTRLIAEPRAQVEHLAHLTTFERKVRRGFQAGARMAVFATIHGPGATLTARGIPADTLTPPHVRVERAPHGAAASMRTATLTHVAVTGERLLARVGVRRPYDWWVARWLTWSYSAGWLEESRRRGLPLIPSPLLWKNDGTRDWAKLWNEVTDAVRGLGDGDAGIGWAVARSAVLRAMEKGALPRRRALRQAAAALRHALREDVGDVADPPPLTAPVDVLLVLDAGTPSNVEAVTAVLAAAEEAGLRAHTVCATANIRTALLGARADAVCSLMTTWGPRRGDGGEHRLQLQLQRLRKTRRAVRVVVGAAGLRNPARLQLLGEAVQYLNASPRLAETLAGPKPTAVLAPSEYFPVTCAALDAADAAGIPYVTLQHGAVNVLYAPFRAHQYWVWDADDAAALRDLQPERASDVHVVRRISDEPAEDTPSREQARDVLDLPVTKRVVLIYSQTHGLEFSGATHFAVAAQLAEVLRRAEDVVLVIKRHPSERRSAYESLRGAFGVERVRVLPEGVSAALCARGADVACALSSTALRDTAQTGCPAIEVLSAESLVCHPVASVRTDVTGLASTILRKLDDVSSGSTQSGLLPAGAPEAQARPGSAADGAPTVAEALTALCRRAGHA